MEGLINDEKFRECKQTASKLTPTRVRLQISYAADLQYYISKFLKDEIEIPELLVRANLIIALIESLLDPRVATAIMKTTSLMYEIAMKNGGFIDDGDEQKQK